MRSHSAQNANNEYTLTIWKAELAYMGTPEILLVPAQFRPGIQQIESKNGFAKTESESKRIISQEFYAIFQLLLYVCFYPFYEYLIVSIARREGSG
jgi:hypothetical protein